MTTRDLRTAAGAALGALGSVLLSMGLVPLRSTTDNSVVALLLVVPVVLGAVVGGAIGGAISALVATLSFDFFFTVPYRSLHIDSANDVETALALLAVALVVAMVSGRADREAAEADTGRSAIRSMHRIADLATQRADRGAVVDRACEELVGLLHLEACEFVASDDRGAGCGTVPTRGGLPQVAHSGCVETNYLRYVDGGFELPVGAQLTARGPRGDEGRFVLHGRPGTPVSLQRRLAAVVIADLVGARLGAEGSATRDDRADNDPDERGAAE